MTEDQLNLIEGRLHAESYVSEPPQHWMDRCELIRECRILGYKSKQNCLPTPEPEYDYSLMVTHRFPSIFELMEEGMDPPGGEWEDKHYTEKVVWVFMCKKTGKIVEVVHKGPLEEE